MTNFTSLLTMNTTICEDGQVLAEQESNPYLLLAQMTASCLLMFPLSTWTPTLYPFSSLLSKDAPPLPLQL